MHGFLPLREPLVINFYLKHVVSLTTLLSEVCIIQTFFVSIIYIIYSSKLIYHCKFSRVIYKECGMFGFVKVNVLR